MHMAKIGRQVGRRLLTASLKYRSGALRRRSCLAVHWSGHSGRFVGAGPSYPLGKLYILALDHPNQLDGYGALAYDAFGFYVE